MSIPTRARRAYETWRQLGLSEAAALEEIRRDGLLTDHLPEGNTPMNESNDDSFVKQLQEGFTRIGFSSEAAQIAAHGRDTDATGDTFDKAVATYRVAGLSEADARVAAIGRDGTEAEARRRLDAVSSEEQEAFAAAVTSTAKTFRLSETDAAARLRRHAGLRTASDRTVWLRDYTAVLDRSRGW